MDEESEWTLWKPILTSLILWSLSYQLLIWLILPKQSPEFNIRLVTVVHGSLSAFVGINQCFLIDSPFEHPEWKTTTTQYYLLIFSLGYFVHDLAWCLIYSRKEKLMIAHHSYSVFAIFRVLMRDDSGAQATCALGSMELTNPFLQLRWFTRTLGYYPSTLYCSIEITFILIFFLVRIVVGTVFLVKICLQPKNAWEFRLMGFMIYIMSWMFMYNIAKYFRNKYGIFTRKAEDQERNGLHVD